MERAPLIKRLSCVVLCVLLAGVARGVEVPEPLNLGSKDVSAYAVVPNLDTLLNNLDVLSATFNPDHKPGTLKAMIGPMLGDPNLGNLDAGKPIALFLLKGPALKAPPQEPPPIVVFIPAKAAAPFDAALQKMQFQTEFKDGLLIAVTNPLLMEKAVGLKPLYDKLKDAGLKNDARVFLGFTEILETYGDLMQKGADAFVQQMGAMPFPGAEPGKPSPMAAILKLELKGGIAFLNQTHALQADLQFKPDAILADTIYVAKAGSATADALVAPAEAQSKLSGLLPAESFLAGSMRINPQAYAAFMKKLVDALTKDADFKDMIDPKVAALMNDAGALFAGDGVFAMSADKEGLPLTSYAMSITDEKKYFEIMDAMMGLFAPDAAIGKLYASMGLNMKMELKKNVREHAGTKIHKMIPNLDTSKMPPDQAAQMKQMVHDIEFAIVKGIYVGTSSAEALDKMIDQVAAGLQSVPAPLKAAKTFGAGKFAYVDYDFVGLIKSTMAAQPNNPIGMIFKQLKPDEPMQGAMVYDKGRLQTQLRIPLGPFQQMAKIFGQAAGPGIKPPPPPPPDKEGKF
jgi:hypothetical protein